MPWVFVTVFPRDRERATDAPFAQVIDALRRTGRFRAVSMADDSEHVIDVSMDAPNVVDAMEVVKRALRDELPRDVWSQFDVYHPPL